jgi:hypothetical protein
MSYLINILLKIIKLIHVLLYLTIILLIIEVNTRVVIGEVKIAIVNKIVKLLMEI